MINRFGYEALPSDPASFQALMVAAEPVDAQGFALERLCLFLPRYEELSRQVCPSLESARKHRRSSAHRSNFYASEAELVQLDSDRHFPQT